MGDRKGRVCPVALAGGLDNRFRRWLQNPRRLLGPYLREGMAVLDFGCGPGFFTIDIADIVGPSGRVIAADLQEGMLQKLRAKLRGTGLESRVTLYQCQEGRIGLSQPVEFVLAFYTLHELPDRRAFFNEIRELLNPRGLVLVVEPPLHVSRHAFEATVQMAREAGFTVAERPRIPFNKAVLLRRSWERCIGSLRAPPG